MTVKIGDVLWCKLDYHGRKWEHRVIVGETRQSWILESRLQKKVKKDDFTENNGVYGRRQWYTEKQKEKHCWFVENHSRIIEKVQRCTDISVLMQVDELFNLDEGCVNSGGCEISIKKNGRMVFRGTFDDFEYKCAIDMDKSGFKFPSKNNYLTAWNGVCPIESDYHKVYNSALAGPSLQWQDRG